MEMLIAAGIVVFLCFWLAGPLALLLGWINTNRHADRLRSLEGDLELLRRELNDTRAELGKAREALATRSAPILPSRTALQDAPPRRADAQTPLAEAHRGAPPRAEGQPSAQPEAPQEGATPPHTHDTSPPRVTAPATAPDARDADTTSEPDDSDAATASDALVPRDTPQANDEDAAPQTPDGLDPRVFQADAAAPSPEPTAPSEDTSGDPTAQALTGTSQDSAEPDDGSDRTRAPAPPRAPEATTSDLQPAGGQEAERAPEGSDHGADRARSAPSRGKGRAAAPPQATPRGLEQLLGANVAIWGGAGALGLAAILLVQYGLQNDWLGPTVRIGLGAAVSLAMIVVGELAFRMLRGVGGGVVGAGVVGLYATIASSATLYEMLAPMVAGAMMCAVTILAATLAIRHRLVIIAVIGLLGGFLTPLLVGSQSGNPTGLMIYLLLLNVGVVVVSSWRRWPALALMAAALDLVAELGWLVDKGESAHPMFLPLVGLLMAPVGVASLLGLGSWQRPEDWHGSTLDRIAAATADAWSWLGLHAVVLGTSLVVVITAGWWDFPPVTWAAQGALGGLAMVLLLLGPAIPRTLPGLAFAMALIHQVAWLIDARPDAREALPLMAAFGGLYLLGLGGLATLRPRRVTEPIMAGVVAMVQLLLAWGWTLDRQHEAMDAASRGRWALCAVGLAVAFAALTGLIGARARSKAIKAPVPAMDASATASGLLLALASPMAADGNPLTLLWLGVVALSLGVAPVLVSRGLILTGMGLLGLVALRLLLPLKVHELAGGWPVLNWILALYGGATATALWCAWRLRAGGGARGWALATRLLGLAFFLGWVTLEIRHAYHPDMTGPVTRAEHLTWSLAWGLVGLGALIFGLVRKSAVARWVSLILIGGTTLKVFLFDLSFLDGLWRVASVAALGVILIGIATLYRLYVFPDAPDDAPDDTSDDAPQQDHEESPEP